MRIHFINTLSALVGKICLFCSFFLWAMTFKAYAHSNSDTLRKKDPMHQTQIKNGEDPQKGQNAVLLKESKQRRSFPQLNSATTAQTLVDAPMMPEFTQEYIAKHATVSSVIADARSQAQATFDEVDKRNRYTESLSPSDLVELPIGLKKRMGNSNVTIGVSRAIFTAGYSQLTVFCKIDMPDGKPIFFGADNIKLSHDGGLVGTSDLVLLGDFDIALNGRNTLMTLKGGFDMKTGDVKKLTYATLECGGIKELGVTADVKFSRSMIVPLDSAYNVIQSDTAYVKGRFQVGPIKDFNDIVANMSLPTFAISKFTKLGFKVKNAVFDFSDTYNDPSVAFPPNYGNLVASNPQLWRGVFIDSLSVILPKEFKDKKSEKRIEFNARKLIIDNAGVSGILSANNILQRGSATGWDFSVDKFEMELQTSSLRRAGFEGAIAIPLTKKDSTQPVKKYGLAYQAVMLSNDVYSLNISLKDSVPFDIWRAKGMIQPGSFVEMTVVNEQFRPKAVLTGSLDINVKDNNTSDTTRVNPKDDKDSDISAKSIVFRKLTLQTESPYIRADYFGYEKTLNGTDTNRIAKFPISITRLALETPAGTTEANIKAALTLNLMETVDNKIKASTGFTLKGEVNKEGEDFKYTYKGFQLDSVSLNADFHTFEFAGKVNIYREDPIMGKGFAGGIGIKIKNVTSKDSTGTNPQAKSKSLRVMAAFGRTTFRYWYADIFAQGVNIPIAPGVNIDGIGGGASYHMVRTSNPSPSPNLPNGLEFKPDSTLGLGFRAMTTFKISASESARGDLTFEMLFNSPEVGGGLAKIGLYGGATFMPSVSFKNLYKNTDSLLFNIKDNLKSVTDQLGGEKLGEYLNAVKLGKTAEIPSKVKPKEQPQSAGSIKASMAIEYDFNARVFDGNFAVIVNVVNGTMRGINNDTAGWAKIRATSTAWYVHMGTPSRPLGVRLSLLGLANFESRTYFMIGDSLEGSPPPPQNVANILGYDLRSLDYMRDLNSLKSGKGFAFGTSFTAVARTPDWGPFYASFSAGIGFDIMVRDYGTAACVQSPSEPIGVQGWRANGQAYAYLQGTLGIKATVFGKPIRIPIISGGAATLLQAKLPNPSWMQGYLGGYYSVLGGALKGRFSCKITLGDDCPLVGVPTNEAKLEFITDITPEINAKNVDVLAVPQVVFRSSIFKEISYFDDAGNETRYLPYLDTFRLLNDVTKLPIEGTLKWNDDFTAAFYESTDALPSDTKIRVIARVKFKVYSNTLNQFVNPGAGYTESRNFVFTTGQSPDSIPLENIKYSYPIVDQKYYHPSESNIGFIRLRQRQMYLINNNTNLAIQISNETGIVGERPAQYNDFKKEIRYQLPPLATSQNYTFTLIAKPSNGGQTTGGDYTANSTVSASSTTSLGEGSTMTETTNSANGLVVRASANANSSTHSLLQFDFKSSQFNTFVDKVNSYNVEEHKIDTFSYNTYGLSAKVVTSEPFEDVETKGNDYTNFKSIIKPEATLTDAYFINSINPMLYSWMPDEYNVKLSRDTSLLGVPPYRGIELINTTNGTSLLNTFPYRYSLSRYYLQDRDDIRTLVEYYYPKQCETIVNSDFTEEEVCTDTYPYYLYDIVNGYFPEMIPGEYPTRLRYVLPDGTETSVANFTYKMCDNSNNNLAADAGIDQILYQNTTNMTAVGNGFWSIVEAPTGFNLTNIGELKNPLTSVNVPVIGSVILRWNVSNGCQKGYDDVVLSRQFPNTDIGPDLCLTNGTFSTVAYGKGNWSLVDKSPNLTINIDSFIYRDEETFGTEFKMWYARLPENNFIKLRWTAENGIFDEIKFSRKGVIDAGNNQKLADTLFVMNANTEGGVWSIVSAPSNFSLTNISNIHDPRATVILSSGSTVVLKWEVLDDCFYGSDTVRLESQRKGVLIEGLLGYDRNSGDGFVSLNSTGIGEWSIVTLPIGVDTSNNNDIILGQRNDNYITVWLSKIPIDSSITLKWTTDEGDYDFITLTYKQEVTIKAKLFLEQFYDSQLGYMVRPNNIDSLVRAAYPTNSFNINFVNYLKDVMINDSSLVYPISYFSCNSSTYGSCSGYFLFLKTDGTVVENYFEQGNDKLRLYVYGLNYSTETGNYSGALQFSANNFTYLNGDVYGSKVQEIRDGYTEFEWGSTHIMDFTNGSIQHPNLIPKSHPTLGTVYVLKNE